MTSIMYVNYEPYGNTGHILDYLKKKFDWVIYVCFIFHPMKRHNTVAVYRQGELIKTISIPALLVPRRWVHYLAPLLSFIHFWELLAIAVYAAVKFKIRPKYFFAPNAFLILIGTGLRTMRLVDKVIFWVWDYYPPPKKGLYLKLLFRTYLALDRRGVRRSDFVWYLNQRLLEIHRKLGVISDPEKTSFVPLGVDLLDVSFRPPVKQQTLGFLGVLKKNQGLELLFSSLSRLVQAVPDMNIEIIGSGPDEEYFIKLAGNNPEGHRVKFFGFIDSDEPRQKELVASWTAALALYIPVENNLSVFADPAKVKYYLSCGTPVIITRVPLLAEEIHKKEAGIVIDYNAKELVSAAIKILRENNRYRENARKLAGEYDYRKIYDRAFSFPAK